MKKKKGGKEKVRRRTGLSILIMVLFIAELLFYTWCRVQCISTGYEINQQLDQQKQLLVFQSRLKIEAERLKSPERIAKIAREKLGLQPPNSEQIILLQ
ncbi:MAG: cell division protein FtsL [Desulfobacterales bacterium]